MNYKKRILKLSVTMMVKKAVGILSVLMLCLNFIKLPAAAMENEKAADVSETGGVLPDNLPAKVCEKQDGISAYSSFPDKLDLSTSKYFPPIRNQEGNSCTAWSQVYYQFTYEAARLNDWDAKHDDSKVFSPKYVWNYLNKGSDSGLLMYDCYDFLKMQGAVRWTEFPQNNLSFEWYTGKNETETTAVLRNALKTRIDDYDYKNFADLEEVPTPVSGNKDSELEDMKKRLNNGQILSVSTQCKVNGTKNNRVLSNGQRGVVAGEINRTASGGIIGHALTIVGYDDTICYDLNQNGSIEEYEKGAFLIANSWGRDAWEHNDGYIWVMYDALNLKSNAANLNGNDRQPFFVDYRYWFIEVKNYVPKRMAEVTLEQKHRDEITVFLYCCDRKDFEEESPGYTILNNIGGTRSFDGGNNGYQTRTFVFDYNAVCGKEVDVENKICGIKVQDFNAGDGADTVVKKIRWIDENGTVLKTLTPQETLDGGGAYYYYGIPAKSISINKTSSTLYKGEKERLTATVGPENTTDKAVKWTSSNTKVVRVSSTGLVTYVGPGTATVTATTTDGTNLSASCVYRVTDDYYDTYDKAWSVTMHSKTPGIVNRSNDVDFFKFTPSAAGNYLIYTTGGTDTKGSLYDASQKLLAENDNSGLSGNNFALQYTLEANKTYYIKVGSSGGSTGNYELNISKDFYGASLAGNNQDARRVQMQAEAAVALTSLKLKIGNNTYILNRPESGNLDVTINGARFKVVFEEHNNGLSVIWSIDARIPATKSGTDTVSFDFSKGIVKNVKSPDLTGLVAYDSAIKTGVEAGRSDSLQRLLAAMQQDGYTLTVRNFDNTLVNVKSSTKAATGMKIIKENSSGQIVSVQYVVVFGDVMGGSVNPGNGVIDSDDSLEVQRAVAGSANLMVLAALAADADHDGNVTTDDSLLILQNVAGIGSINQNYVITTVPDDCYFLDSVIF